MRLVLELHLCGRWTVRDYNDVMPAEGRSHARLSDALVEVLMRASAFEPALKKKLRDARKDQLVT